MHFVPRGKTYTRNAIIYGLFAVLCLVKITEFYVFFLIFAGLCAFYIWQANKHKNDKGSPLYTYFKQRKKNRNSQKKAEKERDIALSKRELRNRYKNRIEEIEAEYAFLDDEDEEEIYESEDYIE